MAAKNRDVGSRFSILKEGNARLQQIITLAESVTKFANYHGREKCKIIAKFMSCPEDTLSGPRSDYTLNENLDNDSVAHRITHLDQLDNGFNEVGGGKANLEKSH